jgi:hypothetical protein
MPVDMNTNDFSEASAEKAARKGSLFLAVNWHGTPNRLSCLRLEGGPLAIFSANLVGVTEQYYEDLR